MILATADNYPQMKNTDRYDLYFSLKDSIFSIINFHQREQENSWKHVPDQSIPAVRRIQILFSYTNQADAYFFKNVDS